LPKSAKQFRDITIFPFSKWLPSAILDFQIFKFFVFQVQMANMHCHIKFHQNSRTAVEISHLMFFFTIAVVIISDLKK